MQNAHSRLIELSVHCHRYVDAMKARRAPAAKRPRSASQPGATTQARSGCKVTSAASQAHMSQTPSAAAPSRSTYPSLAQGLKAALKGKIGWEDDDDDEDGEEKDEYFSDQD